MDILYQMQPTCKLIFTLFRFMLAQLCHSETVVLLLLGARAYVRLNQLNEAIKWCDKGLAVSFIAVDNIYINMQKLL